MDKYDEKAAKVTLAVATIFQMSLGKPSEESAEEVVAAALRESAAEAFEEAAKRAARSISDGSESVEELPNELEVKAAMLRSTTREKGRD